MGWKSRVEWASMYARGFLSLLFLLMVMPSSVLAMGWDNTPPSQGGDSPQTPISAPEIDLGSVLGGMTLLVGGTLILADRRCRSRPQVECE